MARLKLIGCLGRVSNVVVRIAGHPADEGEVLGIGTTRLSR